MLLASFSSFFFRPASTEIYTLSLHDALPIFLSLAIDPQRPLGRVKALAQADPPVHARFQGPFDGEDRKSTRLNSSHLVISYAVFCLKKKTKPQSPLRLYVLLQYLVERSRVLT